MNVSRIDSMIVVVLCRLSVVLIIMLSILLIV